MHILYLSIFDFHFEISTLSHEIHQRLALDFTHFISLQTSTPSEKIAVHLSPPPWNIIPKKRPLKRSNASIIYEESSVRYNDYHGKALTTVNSSSLESNIYSESLHLAHELAYLLILSKSGKKMDLNGLHKIHAMGVQLLEANVIMIAPSKGGKSTLFMKLLSHPSSRIISDDTPVIDRQGRIHAFPLRLGLEDGCHIPSHIDQSLSYKLERRKFGIKVLIPLQGLGRPIATTSQANRNILIIGKRTNQIDPRLIRIGFLRTLPHIILAMIIGIGLPMILEYFLESGLKDIYKRIKIILSRTVAAMMLMIKSEKYLFEMSHDLDANELMLITFLKS